MSKKADYSDLESINVSLDSKMDKQRVDNSLQEIKQTFNRKFSKNKKENSQIDSIGTELQERIRSIQKDIDKASRDGKSAQEQCAVIAKETVHLKKAMEEAISSEFKLV